ncbi:extracellular solute-binding protein [Paenibacillus oralis]|uniref:Extracellular solute-binding protein n=1 Tax=Paenibacillus oralis TaxID=2490856 RepID=A0A3P3U8X7_9BACL|nr:extracellular solute-binding protein [Paenibacillus oralis]RRJ66019.1 extracellular solute-binding protein [Paenibacillus oralis]
MKKWLLGIVALMVCVSLTACNSSGGEIGKNGNENKGASTTKDGKTVVTLSVLQKDPNGWLDQAAQTYEQAHPDIDIVIKEYLTTPDRAPGQALHIGGDINPAELETYRNTMNTELMSGKGPDLISVSNLNYGQYADKNLLADIGELMKNDQNFAIQDYYTNVLDAVKHEGKLVAMPIVFWIHTLTSGLGPSDLQVDEANWTWNDLLNKGKEMAEKDSTFGVMGAVSPSSLLSKMVLGEFNQYVDQTAKQAKFDSPSFIQLLNNVRDMYDNGLLSQDYDKLIEDRDLFRDETYYAPVMLYQALQTNRQILNLPSSGDKNGLVFSSNLMLAINEKSAVKQEAWDFMKYLISEEMQSHPALFMAFPINKTVLTSVLTNQLKNSSVQTQAMGGDQKSDPNTDRSVVDEGTIQKITQFVEKPGRFLDSDPRFMSIIEEESSAFFEGKKSAEEVAATIQNRTQLYLNE